MRPILLATDGSPSARLATAEAIELACATGWPLRVVTSWSVPVSEFAADAITDLREVAAAERDSAEAALAAAAAIETAGLEAEAVLRHGSAISMICAEVRSSGPRLLVVGARGWGRLGRLDVGSVSLGVLELAPCPVLVVREAHESGARAEVEAGETATIL